MPYPDVPLVRLTIEHLRSEITMALTTRAVELGQAIQRAVDHAVDAFDFEVEVGKIAERVLRDLLEQELKATLYDTTVRAAMKTALVKAMRRPA